MTLLGKFIVIGDETRYQSDFGEVIIPEPLPSDVTPAVMQSYAYYLEAKAETFFISSQKPLTDLKVKPLQAFLSA